MALAPFREDSGTWEAPERAGGGLRTVDLLPAAERHAIGLSVTIGLGLAAIAVALGITGDPLLAAGALGIGAAIVVRGYVRRRAETVRLAKLLAGQTRILEMVATGAALTEVLDALCRVVEKQVTGLLCSVLLLEGDRLRRRRRSRRWRRAIVAASTASRSARRSDRVARRRFTAARSSCATSAPIRCGRTTAISPCSTACRRAGRPPS